MHEYTVNPVAKLKRRAFQILAAARRTGLQGNPSPSRRCRAETCSSLVAAADAHKVAARGGTKRTAQNDLDAGFLSPSVYLERTRRRLTGRASAV